MTLRSSINSGYEALDGQVWVEWVWLEYIAQRVDELDECGSLDDMNASNFLDNPSILAIIWGELFNSYNPALFESWKFLSTLDVGPHCWEFSLRFSKNSHALISLLYIKLAPQVATTIDLFWGVKDK